MPTPLNTADLERRARAVLDARIGVVRALAVSRQAVADKRAELEHAQREDSTAYAAALRAGWTAEELRKVGLDAPTRRAPGRPRTSAARNGAHLEPPAPAEAQDAQQPQ